MILTHGPYIALVGDSQPDDLMHGHVVNMQADGLRFAGRDFEELKKAFTNAVDDYTARCRERGVEPEEPSKIQLTSRYTLDQALIYAQQDWSYAATLAYYSTGEIDRLTDDPEIAEPFGHKLLSLVVAARQNQRLHERHVEQAQQRFENSISADKPDGSYRLGEQLKELKRSEAAYAAQIADWEEDHRLRDGAVVLLAALQKGTLTAYHNGEPIPTATWIKTRIEDGKIRPRPISELTFRRNDVLRLKHRSDGLDETEISDEALDGASNEVLARACREIMNLEWARRQDACHEFVPLRSLVEAALALTEARRVLSGELLAIGSADELKNEAYRRMAIAIDAGSLKGMVQFRVTDCPPSALEADHLRTFSGITDFPKAAKDELHHLGNILESCWAPIPAAVAWWDHTFPGCPFPEHLKLPVSGPEVVPEPTMVPTQDVAANPGSSQKRMNDSIAGKFIQDYVRQAKEAGRQPSQLGAEEAAADAGYVGHRDFIRKAWVAASLVRPRGRPKNSPK